MYAMFLMDLFGEPESSLAAEPAVEVVGKLVQAKQENLVVSASLRESITALKKKISDQVTKLKKELDRLLIEKHQHLSARHNLAAIEVRNPYAGQARLGADSVVQEDIQFLESEISRITSALLVWQRFQQNLDILPEESQKSYTEIDRHKDDYNWNKVSRKGEVKFVD